MKRLVAEYIWLDKENNFRSKVKVIIIKDESLFHSFYSNIEFYPDWNYDGSSTNQATTEDSELFLKPARIYENPFRRNTINTKHVIALCEIFTKNGPLSSRNDTVTILNKYIDEHPMFGLELEFFLFKDKKPLGMPDYPNSFPEEQGKYYCGIGTSKAIGRNFIEEVFENALKMNLSLTGLNAEVAPGQWEFQICNIGIKACDDFMMIKYLLERTAEKYDYEINYDPKPIKGNWNGSGCHINFSTFSMREGKDGKKGIDIINLALEKLKVKHVEHMEIYGKNNEERLTGKHETANYEDFTVGIANRGCSIRIPNLTVLKKKGYFEDRRPASNIDPYLACSKILETCCSK